MISKRVLAFSVAVVCVAIAGCSSSHPTAALPTPSASPSVSSVATPTGVSSSASATPESLVVQRAARPVQFATPSANILCMVGEDALCKSFKHRWRAPARPARCDALAYGDTLVLLQSGTRVEFLCQGDNTFFDATPVLSYQHAWRYRDTECVSRRTGVTCMNVATGHGFFISLASYRLF